MRTKLATSCFLLSILLLPMTSHAADLNTAASSTREIVKDSVITTKIKTMLAEKSPSSMMHITVDTDKKGVVWLSGTAKNQAEIDNAGSIARSVAGVASVENHIRIIHTRPEPITKTTHADQIEAHIKMLHDKLKITPAEQAQWLEVAQIIRDNEQQMFMLIKSRAEKTDMNAIDDLKSYSEIADAHANDIKKFIPAFTRLYDNMPAAQKKDADALFHQHDHQHKQQDSKHFNSEQS